MADSSHYGEPTWGSKVLVMTFSVAVAFMAGWLVLALVLRESDAPATMADHREVPAMATKQPPRVAAPAVVSRALVAASQLLSPKADPVAPTGSVPSAPPPNVAPVTPDAAPVAAAAAPASPAVPAVPAAPAPAMQLASLPPVPVVSPPETVPAAQPGSAVAPEKAAVGDIYAPVTNKMTEDDPVAAPEVVPLPPRRPHFAAVPLPRPRPQIPEEQVRAEPQTLVDFLTNGWR
jgi:hypothetical protein